MRTIAKILIISIIVLALIPQNVAQKIEEIDTKFPLHWSSNSGNVTYRSNIVYYNGKIIIGSNGEQYNDYALDKNNGVKVLNANTGKEIYSIAGESWGDMDVNGILVYKNKLYFGNDNDEFLCTSFDGEIYWRVPTSGDIEHQAYLINKHIVFATETGEIRAVNPSNGNTKWVYYHPDSFGWKQGDNRLVFKVKAHFYSGKIFFDKPKVSDLNLDGVPDLLYKNLYAINGANGKLLFNIKLESEAVKGFYSFSGKNIAIVGKGSNKKILINRILYKYERNNNSFSGTTSYKNQILVYNRFGKKVDLKVYSLAQTSSESLNSLQASTNTTIIPFRSALFVYDITKDKPEFIKTKQMKDKVVVGNKEELRDRFPMAPIIGNRVFEYKNEQCVMLLYQLDYSSDNSKAAVSIVGLNSKKTHCIYYLPSGSECVPHIEDVNIDGKLDLLISCYDGNLYCYDLGINSDKLALK
jgi:outer membrane protein assembly factor BamB